MTSRSLHAYLVCATPRSGSTLLCELLRATGVAGQPLEHFEILRHSSLPRQPREYFTDLDDARVRGLLAPLQARQPSTEPAERWWARIQSEGRTPNGVWGGKIMWGHVDDFLGRARELPGMSGADLRSALVTLLDDPLLIFVTRADKVAQAVSLWRAVQTEAWRAQGRAASGNAVYDFVAIDHLVGQLASEEQCWRAWFDRIGAHPLEVTYEELDRAPQATAAAVLRALGVPADHVPPPPLARQRDEVSSAWADRYLREREDAA